MEPTQSLVYAKRGDRPLRLHLFSPQQTELKHPVILWIHGGGWREGSPLPIPIIFSMFLKMGIAVAALEHRLTSQSADFPGQLVRWPAPGDRGCPSPARVSIRQHRWDAPPRPPHP